MFRIDGIYANEEWTDYTDIGKTFNGRVFTEPEYLCVEKQYIDSCLAIIKQLSITQMAIVGYEEYEPLDWYDNQDVSIDVIDKLISDCLRNKCWCKLKSHNIYIHFGYDFYMYIGCKLKPPHIQSICKQFNLYSEVVDSPYN